MTKKESEERVDQAPCAEWLRELSARTWLGKDMKSFSCYFHKDCSGEPVLCEGQRQAVDASGSGHWATRRVGISIHNIFDGLVVPGGAEIPPTSTCNQGATVPGPLLCRHHTS
jgi:hypothetical protein